MSYASVRNPSEPQSHDIFEGCRAPSRPGDKALAADTGAALKAAREAARKETR
jgi:hypothetical protein